MSVYVNGALLLGQTQQCRRVGEGLLLGQRQQYGSYLYVEIKHGSSVAGSTVGHTASTTIHRLHWTKLAITEFRLRWD